MMAETELCKRRDALDKVSRSKGEIMFGNFFVVLKLDIGHIKVDFIVKIKVIKHNGFLVKRNLFNVVNIFSEKGVILNEVVHRINILWKFFKSKWEIWY